MAHQLLLGNPQEEMKAYPPPPTVALLQPVLSASGLGGGIQPPLGWPWGWHTTTMYAMAGGIQPPVIDLSSVYTSNPLLTPSKQVVAITTFWY